MPAPVWSPLWLRVVWQAQYLTIWLGKIGFQIEGCDLIHNITEDRLRHASVPVHYHPIRYIYNLFIHICPRLDSNSDLRYLFSQIKKYFEAPYFVVHFWQWLRICSFIFSVLASKLRWVGVQTRPSLMRHWWGKSLSPDI